MIPFKSFRSTRMWAYMLPLAAVSALSVAVIGGCSEKPSEAEAADDALSFSGEGLVISQVYVGGNAETPLDGAKYPYDFVEIFNQSPSPRRLDGLSLFAGTKDGTLKKNLLKDSGFAPGTQLLGGEYLLVRLGVDAPPPVTETQTDGGTDGGSEPPPADVDAGTAIVDAGGTVDPGEMPTTSATQGDEVYFSGKPDGLDEKGGKVALAKRDGASFSRCGAGTSCLLEQGTAERIIDMVGWGDATDFEGRSLGSLDGKWAVRRTLASQCRDTQDNAADFEIVEPEPRSRSTPPYTECWKGATGAAGDAGRDGIDGINGLNGDAGRDGVDGIPGTPGGDGTNGKDGVDGQHGRDGLPGNDGAKGAAGPAGPAGKTQVSAGGCSAAPGSMSEPVLGFGLAALLGLVRGRRRNKRDAK